MDFVVVWMNGPHKMYLVGDDQWTEKRQDALLFKESSADYWCSFYFKKSPYKERV